MLQRAVWVVRDRIDPDRLVQCDDGRFVRWITTAAAGTPAEPLVDGLFGPVRRLFKRAASFDAVRHPEVHKALAGRPYTETATIAGRLAERLTARLGTAIGPHELLVDAPPAEREVEFRLRVRERADRGTNTVWHWLEDLSPVVRSLAREQFDDLVKRVRVFAAPHVADRIASLADLPHAVLEATHG